MPARQKNFLPLKKGYIMLKEKPQAIRYSLKGEARSRNLDADLNMPQVAVFDQKKVASSGARLLNRRYETINGKRYLVVS